MIKNLQEEDIEKLEEADQFSMPLVSIKAERVVQQLCNKKLKNKNFEHITMTSLVETIKLNINETGVKVQNEGYIMLQNCISGISPKQLHLNRPFWVLMKERKKYPYLISFITQPI